VSNKEACPIEASGVHTPKNDNSQNILPESNTLAYCRITARKSFITLDCEGKKRNFCLKLFSKNPNFILKSSEPRLSELGSVPKINETLFFDDFETGFETGFQSKN
jgi:hypothetical protein